MRKELEADLMLLFIAVTWGASNYVISLCMSDLTPLTVNMYRFAIGTVTIALLGFKRLNQIHRATIKYALLISIFLTLSYLFTNLAIERTTLSNCGFYCALSVLFVPLVEWVWFKKKPGKKLAFVIFISCIGVLLLSLKGDFTVNLNTIEGDLLSLACAVSYTFDIIIIDRAVQKEEVDAFSLGFMQIAFTFVLSSALAFIMESPSLPSGSTSILGLVFLGALCTGAAFVLQPIAQQYTPSTHVGLILALEPVFCAIIAFFLADEILFEHNYVGMCLLLMGILVLEIDFKNIFKRKKSRL